MLDIDPDFTKRPMRWRPYLEPKDALQRRLQEQEHRDWRAEDWGNVWWSDECSVRIGDGEAHQWAWMHTGEQWLPENMLKRSRNHESLSLWAMMRADGTVVWRFTDENYEGGRTNTGLAYKALLEDVLPQYYLPGQAFMHDNAPIHTAHVAKECLERMGIWVLKHPPYSPDLNCIEHLWPALKQLLWELHPELKYLSGGKETKKRAFKRAIKHTFEVMLQDPMWDLPAKLVASMPARYMAVRKARGFQTRY